MGEKKLKQRDSSAPVPQASQQPTQAMNDLASIEPNPPKPAMWPTSRVIVELHVTSSKPLSPKLRRDSRYGLAS